MDLNCLVDFKALANPGWEFVCWEPNIGATWDVRSVAASSVSAVKATFRPKMEWTLELEVENAGGNGAPRCAGYVTVDEAKRYYTPTDDPVTLTAIPEPGYRFLFWEGDYLYSEQNPLEFDVAEFGTDCTIEAVFLYDPFVLMQDTRRILETDGDLDENEIPDNVAFISAAPAMPNLSARINGARIDTPVRMRLVVSYTEGNRNDVSYFPGPGQSDFVQLSSGQAWSIPFGTTFVGGDATLTYQYE